jgi:hypothetical protein
VVAWTDYRGYFNPDYTNDHTRRKWNAYYDLTRKAPVDVVMIGNSHLYTGLNPEHLSNALGATCFILASPGTTMTDAYFTLKEAVKVKKPKMVILETFTLYDYESHELKAGALSDQFKSFAARKDVGQKLASMPVLFQSDNYLPAWSNTIRNHSFIFTDTTQLKQNILLGRQKPPREQGLYLGRYIRFTSGLEENTLKKYDEPGFVAYNYAEKLPGDEAIKYLRKAIALCKKEKIELVLLTLPMYHRHVQGYETYKNEILKAIGDKQSWLDLQLPYDTTAFTPESFENTVAPNQHMTYQGSLVAAYKLAHYLHKKHAKAIPNRSGERKWIELFYGSDGYFINNSPLQDGVSKVLMNNVSVAGTYELIELILVPERGAKQLMLKLVRKDMPNSPSIPVPGGLSLTAAGTSYTVEFPIFTLFIIMTLLFIVLPSARVNFTSSIVSFGFVSILSATSFDISTVEAPVSTARVQVVPPFNTAFTVMP